MAIFHSCLEVYDHLKGHDGTVIHKKGAVLDCIWKGYPIVNMGFVFEDLLREAHKRLPYYWSSSRVTAWFVKLTGNQVNEVEALGPVSQVFKILPSYEFNSRYHHALWQIYLTKYPGEYDLRYHKVVIHDFERNIFELDARDWRQEYDRHRQAMNRGEVYLDL